MFPTGINSIPHQVIYKPSDEDIHYKQKVFIRWLKPPTPPPPAPIIIREIQSPPEIPPPIVYRSMPECPRTPPPIIVREQMPSCQSEQTPIIVQRRLPPVCCPQQVLHQKCCSVPVEKRVIIEKESCPPPPPPQCRRLVKEVIRRVPQVQPSMICSQHQQQFVEQSPPQIRQELIPVFATRQRIVQPKGIRVIRQVIGPATRSIQ